ncbi:hypothetical protein [Labilibacter marinus]|uniref:hypothetical protein n=1 Tax=Labilibacter marinus TaxID=1477105 RepID=UPI00117B2C64|nr:hypothetical protein [Labilibacter marinus]
MKNGNWNGEKVEVNRVNGQTGTHDKCMPRLIMTNVFEIGSHGEGLFIDSDQESRGSIQVGMEGSIKLSDQRYLEIDMSSLESSKTYTVFGLEQGEIVEGLMSYHPMTINSDETEKVYGTTDKEEVALPLTGLEKVEMIRDNGQSMTYTPTELKALMEQENDMVAISTVSGTETAYWGYKNYALLDIEDIKEIRITKTAGAAYELILVNSKN